MASAHQLGYSSRNLICSYNGKELRYRNIAKEILAAREKYLFVRTFLEFNVLFLPILLAARIQGKFIFFDVPTPHTVAEREILRQQSPLHQRILRFLLLRATGPLSFLPANIVIQHAKESRWHSIGNKHKTRLLGHGIDLQTFRQYRTPSPWPARTLRLVGVANVSFWHGYDRVVRAIHDWVSTEPRPYFVSFTIIGRGRESDNLMRLVTHLNLTQFVFFTGQLEKPAILEHYCNSHLAVGSIGIHRKGLTMSAELKAREYCLAGIPFIASGDDPDFDPNPAFRLTVSLTDDIDDITKIFETFGQIRESINDSEIWEFAKRHLCAKHHLRTAGLPELP